MIKVYKLILVLSLILFMFSCDEKMQIEDVLVTCLDSNIASKKIILSQGGILQNKIFFEEENENICRYIIKNNI